MIYMNAGDHVLLVLEPGNIRRIMMGQPLKTKVNGKTLGITYTPDIEWVQAEVGKLMDDGKGVHIDSVTKVLEDSLKRDAIDRGTDMN